MNKDCVEVRATESNNDYDVTTTIAATVVDEGDTMVGCQPSFDGLTKCVVAACLSCLGVSANRRQRRSGSCLC